MGLSVIFHIVRRGNSTQRLALIHFAQLLDPRWKAPSDIVEVQKQEKSKSASVLNSIAQSAYNFVQGGVAGALGATIVYPIDLGG